MFTLSVPLRVPTPEEAMLFKEAASLLLESSAAVFPRVRPSDIRMPYAAAAANIAVPVPQDHPPALRVLVADDHALNLNLVSRLLGKSGFLVVPVKDGKEALDALIASFTEASPGSSFHCAVRYDGWQPGPPLPPPRASDLLVPLTPPLPRSSTCKCR